MTLPKDVAEAVDSLNRRAPDAAWQIILAHLLSQDAEIGRLSQESIQRFIRGREWAELSGRNERRAELAESRLAAANALLQRTQMKDYDAAAWLRLGVEIQAHLSENTMTAPSLLDERVEVLPLVIDDLESRIAGGAKQYGEPLTTHNGRDTLWDAYEEALDLCLYLRQTIEERRSHHAALAGMAKRLEAAEKDAAYGRALIDAMNCEYQAAKESRKGGKQRPWITTYTLLRRLKSAADHMAETGNLTTEGEE